MKRLWRIGNGMQNAGFLSCLVHCRECLGGPVKFRDENFSIKLPSILRRCARWNCYEQSCMFFIKKFSLNIAQSFWVMGLLKSHHTHIFALESRGNCSLDIQSYKHCRSLGIVLYLLQAFHLQTPLHRAFVVAPVKQTGELQEERQHRADKGWVDAWHKLQDKAPWISAFSDKTVSQGVKIKLITLF